MEIKEFWSRKRQLEGDIASSVHRMIRDFSDEAGVSVCGVSIDMIDVSGVTSEHYVIGNVQVTIKGIA